MLFNMKFFDEMGFSDTVDQMGLIFAMIFVIIAVWMIITSIARTPGL
jgi:hypothetical protein